MSSLYWQILSWTIGPASSRIMGWLKPLEFAAYNIIYYMRLPRKTTIMYLVQIVCKRWSFSGGQFQTSVFFRQPSVIGVYFNFIQHKFNFTKIFTAHPWSVREGNVFMLSVHRGGGCPVDLGVAPYLAPDMGLDRGNPPHDMGLDRGSLNLTRDWTGGSPLTWDWTGGTPT